MWLAILSLSLLLLTLCQWAPSSLTDVEAITIQRVKTLPVSSLDRSLPNVTLDFFLKYEGRGVPIKWRVLQCGEQTEKPARGADSAMCAEAEIDLRDRAATVLVLVGRFKRGPVDSPTVCDVKVTYEGGTTHRLRRLSDLPVELHRPLPRGPKDLPAPVNALLTILLR